MASRKKQRGPGERAGLDLEAVLNSARRLSEREGPEGLTMRRLARQMGVAPNALYSYFPDKAALLAALLDGLLADIDVPRAHRLDWREGLSEVLRQTRRLLLAHPQLIPLFLSQPGRGPNALRLGELMLSFLERAGLTAQRAVDALRILLTYAFGFAALEAPRLADPAAEVRVEQSEAAFRTARDLPRMRELAPRLARHPDDRTFELGLTWLLQGMSEK